MKKPSRINAALRVLDGFSYLCCHADKRASADKPLALSIRYEMIRSRGRFSLDLSGVRGRGKGVMPSPKGKGFRERNRMGI